MQTGMAAPKKLKIAKIELDIQPSELENIDSLFDLYSKKIRDLEILDRSLETTNRAKEIMASLLSTMQKEAANDNVPGLRVEVKNLERTIIQRLAERPEDLHRLRSRQFEELVCALLADMGYEVQLTQATKDGGRDILAVVKTSVGELLTIVECKKYRKDRPVSIHEIRSFLFTVREKDRASFGLLATTSYFSRDSINLAADYAYQLKLEDFEGVHTWLKKYGTWTQGKDSGFWLPDRAKQGG